LWSAGKGTGAVITALNIAYDQEETRGFVRRKGLELLFTLGGIVFALLALGAVVALPLVLGKVGLGEEAALLVRWLRWPALAVLVMIGLAVLYHYGPSREKPRWRWVSWGAVIAAALWLLGSAGFSLYVSHLGKYGQTYGSLGAIVILLTWFYLSAYVVILGAELNAELERQTRKDTTEGAPRPMGERGAYAADTVGEPA
jgi:membrane protein